MASVDLTVMGAGIFGLSIAWEATRRGARVRVIEPGAAVTMDHVPNRLNVEIGADGRIKSVRCG